MSVLTLLAPLLLVLALRVLASLEAVITLAPLLLVLVKVLLAIIIDGHILVVVTDITGDGSAVISITDITVADATFGTVELDFITDREAVAAIVMNTTIDVVASGNGSVRTSAAVTTGTDIPATMVVTRRAAGAGAAVRVGQYLSSLKQFSWFHSGPSIVVPT